MKIILRSLSCLIAVLLLTLSGCKDKSTDPRDIYPVKPVVKVTTADYDSASFIKLFPDHTSLKSIDSAYSGNNYSEDVKSALNEYMRQQVIKLREDAAVFDKVISLSRCKMKGAYILPTYAEKAKYNGKDVWIIQVAWGIGAADIGHFRCLAYGLEKFDTLDVVQCR